MDKETLIFKEFFKLLDKKGWDGWFIDFMEIQDKLTKRNQSSIKKIIKAGISSIVADNVASGMAKTKTELSKGYSYPFKDKSIGLHDGVHRPIYEKKEKYKKSKNIKRRSHG